MTFSNAAPIVPKVLPEPDDRELQPGLRLTVERSKFFARRLDALATEVDLTEVLQFVLPNLGGAAPARIVAEPVSVTVKHEVRGEDRASRRTSRCCCCGCRPAAKGQAPRGTFSLVRRARVRRVPLGGRLPIHISPMFVSRTRSRRIARSRLAQKAKEATANRGLLRC
jgi:hypothetical protein